MTALLGSHEDIAVPPHPVTAVERMSLTGSVNGSSNLRSTGAEILRLNSVMACFAVKKIARIEEDVKWIYLNLTSSSLLQKEKLLLICLLSLFLYVSS